MWSKYPRQMLRSRVVSEGIRTVFPAVLCGMYTPEEIRDMEPLDVTPIRTTDVPTPSPAPPAEKKKPAPKSAPLSAIKKELLLLLKNTYEKEASVKSAFHSLTGKESFGDISDEEAQIALDKLKQILAVEEASKDVPEEPPFDVEDNNG